RALSLLLSLMLVLGTISVVGLTASAADINLKVGGVSVTDDNKDDVLGDGTVSYDPVSRTLTLNNANITANDNAIFAAGSVEYSSNLTIILKGKNYLSGGDNALYTSSVDTVIDGSQGGTLKAEGRIYAPYAPLTIQNVSNLEVRGRVFCPHTNESSAPYALKIIDSRVAVESDDTEAIYTTRKPFIISGSSVVTAQASYSAMQFPGRLTLEDGLSLSYPEGGTVGPASILNPDGTNARRAVIGNAYYIDPESNPTEGGTVSGGGLYNSGSTATVTATPNENYRFVNWTENGDEVSTDAEYSFTVTGNRELVANFERVYTVKFVNDDGTELQSSSAAYGETPVYTGETPTKEAAAQYTYSFLAWTPSIVPVTEDATYKATYTQTPREYEIKFVNEDGSELQKSYVAYGETPVYTGETPTKEQSDQYVYTFGGWSPEITSVTTDATYTATFTQAPRKYEIKFVNDDGTELQSGQVIYGGTPAYTGEMPTKEATAEYTYSFLAWIPSLVPVTTDATYTATYTSTPVDYKLTWKVDGESYKNETVPFGTEISKPDDPAKDGYTFKWVDQIPETMPAQDVTINGSFTPVEYTATFVDENGKTVEAVKFTVETDSIKEPAVPEKAGYTGEWEKYTLGTSDITIKPVYENITSIRIDDFEENTEIGYKENMIFRASTADMPEGAEIHWFVNGEDVGAGEGLGVEEPTEDYTVQAKVLDKDGSVLAESGTMNVKVRNGFFDRLLAFFSSLFDKIFGGALSDLFGSIC
ncbi:MAG: InlB B-repeat-containing protein, partial [Clostridia bacterium]|nr:InlB B-repeat-containing protein [Clostridia bacterium]